MPLLYRVFPSLPSAAPRDPGGPLYIPPQHGGRLDNPGVYRVFYASDAPAGAIAEAFGRFSEWTGAMLAGSPSLPGSLRSLARYRLPDAAAICDLDDPRRLRELGLRPSQIVSRDYERTRAWARKIYETGRWAGVRWWSYYDPRWASLGIWDQSGIAVENVAALALDHPAVIEAARTIARRIFGGKR